MPTNAARAENAFRAVQTYMRFTTGEDQETVLSDLLTDLQHYAAEQGIDFSETLIRAARHYQTEVREGR